MPRFMLKSLVFSTILSRLDYGNATIAGIPSYLLDRLQLVMYSATSLVFTSSKYDHITPLLQQLHWLKDTEQIDYKLAVLDNKCLHGTAPPYLVDEFYQLVDLTLAFRCVISDRRTQTTVHHRRLHFSSRQCSCLERSPRDVTLSRQSTFSTCLLQAPEISSLQALFSLTERTVVVLAQWQSFWTL